MELGLGAGLAHGSSPWLEDLVRPKWARVRSSCRTTSPPPLSVETLLIV